MELPERLDEVPLELEEPARASANTGKRTITEQSNTATNFCRNFTSDSYWYKWIFFSTSSRRSAQAQSSFYAA
jgi:hypothetical protein